MLERAFLVTSAESSCRASSSINHVFEMACTAYTWEWLSPATSAHHRNACCAPVEPSTPTRMRSRVMIRTYPPWHEDARRRPVRDAESGLERRKYLRPESAAGSPHGFAHRSVVAGVGGE